MSILDFFKAKWSSDVITFDDRKRIFWYLKRKTSYTAWEREAVAFDNFADLFERQVREEPLTPPKDCLWPTDWEGHLPEVLKIQVLYEQGLARLKTGDRSVWLYNSIGVLEEAHALAFLWHSNLVHGGPRGDLAIEGKYFDELKASIDKFSVEAQNTGYLQDKMADAPAPECWPNILAAIPWNTPRPGDLPDILDLPNAPCHRSGAETPVSGIYEPQTKDGCMNYLLGGTSAPPILEVVSGHVTDNLLGVTWRLIWEDDRYLDGTIPAEELQYFKQVAGEETPKIAPVREDTYADSGARCPRSGLWGAIDDLNSRTELREGDLMPTRQGRDTKWVLLE